jgi:hypothetical protein
MPQAPRHGGRRDIPQRSDLDAARDDRGRSCNMTKECRMSDETKRPTNLRANVMPTDGYVLTIDGKLKARYETEMEATAEGSKLKQRFPVIQVAVYDAAGRIYTPVDLPPT